MIEQKAASSGSDDLTDAGSVGEYGLVRSLRTASLMAFTGGSLDAFLYLNHGHVFAGVMTGNAVLCGIGVFNRSVGDALHYAWPLFAYVCGIWLVAVFRKHRKRHPVRLALMLVIVGLFTMSFLSSAIPEAAYVFLVVLLTGFMVGISQKVDSYAYNATVLTGSLRDGTISLYQAFDPRTRYANLRKSRDLWSIMASFFAGAVCGGLLGQHIGNHALWLPVAVLCVVLALVVTQGSRRTGFDLGRSTSALCRQEKAEWP